MSTEIINVLEYLCDKLGIAIDWTSENVWPQVMDVLGRYRILQLTSKVIFIFGFLIVTIVFIALWKKAICAYNIARKEQSDNLWWEYYSNGNSASDAYIALVIASIFIVLPIIVALVFCTSDFMYWLLVPEIKYLDMLKTYIQ